MRGKIIEWYDDKGYGFITPTTEKLRVFFHISSLQNQNCRPQINDSVSFNISKDQQGRYSAQQINLHGKNTVKPTLLFSLTFLLFVAITSWFWQHDKWLFIGYLLMSLVTFIAYYIDKRAAKNGRWRTAESTLHLLSLAGGWPGALYAQHRLRHKSRKQPFKTILWLTILINILIYCWTLTASGAIFIQSFVRLVNG